MEHIEGFNLEKIIKIQGVLSEVNIKKYCKQMIDALIYLHSKNIIHRYFFRFFLKQITNLK